MQEHCSIGLVITTDGSITDIPRKDYLDAEGRAITDMKATGKPFLVIINSRNPNSDEALSVQKYIREHFDVEPAVADCQALSGEGINGLLKSLLYAFPMTQLQVHLPRWMDALECSHPIKAALYEALITRVQQIETLAQAAPTLQKLKELENVLDFSVQNVDLATGTVCCTVTFPEKLFYEILSKRTGMDIGSDGELMQILIQLAQVKKEYDKISDAMAQVQATGYGVVMPTAQEMKLEKPELVRKNGSFGVKLKAGAPSIHMIRVEVDTEISPMVGDEKQSKDLVDFLTGEEPEKRWESNIFGKSVGAMIQEGLTSKLLRTPEEVRGRFRGTLSRVVNEGANGLICLIL